MRRSVISVISDMGAESEIGKSKEGQATWNYSAQGAPAQTTNSPLRARELPEVMWNISPLIADKNIPFHVERRTDIRIVTVADEERGGLANSCRARREEPKHVQR